MNSLSSFLNNTKLGKFHRGLLFWGLFIITFTGYGSVAYGSVISSATEEWNLNSTQLGFIGSASELGMLFGAIVFGFLSDKIGFKKILISLTLSFSVFTFCLGLATNAITFAALRFLAGVSYGGIVPIVISLLTEYSPSASKSKTVAVALCGNQIGGIIISLMAIVLIPLFGWRSVFWIAVVPIVLIGFLIKFVPESAQHLIKSGSKDKLEEILKKIDVTYSQKVDVDLMIKEGQKVIPIEEKVSYSRLFN